MSLNSYQLKSIALLTMLIDHFAVIFHPCFSIQVYYTLRSIGRLAFPLYCFLLVEGFFHTSNRERYLTRLLLFSLLSEIPFDLVFSKREITGKFPFDASTQNVFFTLSIGFLAMMLLEHYEHNKTFSLLIIFGTAYLGDFIHCDYGAFGIVTILLLYLFRKDANDWSRYRSLLIIGMIPLLLIGFDQRFQLFCIFSLFFMRAYNGEKGHGPRSFFYLAYPAHLLLLYMISTYLLPMWSY